jgi:hypothetical protein
MFKHFHDIYLIMSTLKNRLHWLSKLLSLAIFLKINPVFSQSITEKNGFIAQHPLLHIKLGFAVEDSEKNIVEVIKDASTSIAFFSKEIAGTHGTDSKKSITYIVPEARDALRLPPEATNGTDRYVAMNFYCWKLLNPTKLQVNIEWADITTPRRYTDSYVFEKAGDKWLLLEHGNMEPFRYELVGYQFKRPCPKT